mmetsp:Transcript_4269/g.8131  ORF Transcript_4269/g.8131 Transcript_4269/m.8131 type:complete len:224 (-) Transcript_4269:124-795(-)
MRIAPTLAPISSILKIGLRLLMSHWNSLTCSLPSKWSLGAATSPQRFFWFIRDMHTRFSMLASSLGTSLNSSSLLSRKSILRCLSCASSFGIRPLSLLNEMMSLSSFFNRANSGEIRSVKPCLIQTIPVTLPPSTFTPVHLVTSLVPFVILFMYLAGPPILSHASFSTSPSLSSFVVRDPMSCRKRDGLIAGGGTEGGGGDCLFFSFFLLPMLLERLCAGTRG